MSERTLMLGLDLCEDTSQLAVYDMELLEPVLIGQTEDNPDALLPTQAAPDGVSPVKDILRAAADGDEIIVDGKSTDVRKVMAFFFRKTLALTRKRYPAQTIRYLAVTVPYISAKLLDRLYDALAIIGMDKDRVTIISHKQSYMYYILYQKKELFTNDVGLFDYDGDRLIYDQLTIDRRRTPALVGVKERDLTEGIRSGEDGKEELVQVFENVVTGAIRGQILSSLFMTGEGFEQEWTDELFPKLAIGRRMFKGRNLYVSGACYAAKEIADKSKLDRYLMLSEDMISSTVSMDVYDDGEIRELVLARAGQTWFRVDEEVDLIPDGDDELVLRSEHIFNGEKKKFILDLAPVLGRVDRMCRIGVRLRFADVHTGIVTIRDRGFGTVAPGTNRVWEETITCS